MLTLRQLIAMAKIATHPDKKFMEIIRKVWFKDNKVVVTDTGTLFEKKNSGIEGDFALNSDEIIKKIKVKDNKEFPFLMIEKGKINSTVIKEANMDFPEYEKFIPEINETSWSIPVSKSLLEKMLNCFEVEDLIITFVGKKQPIIFESRDKNERGLIMPLIE